MGKKYTKDETLKEANEFIIKKEKEIDLLYNTKCVNWRGETTDTKQYYTEVIAKQLLDNDICCLYDRINTITREDSYNVDTHDGYQVNKDSNRKEEVFAKKIKDKKCDGIGEILDYQIPLKNVSSDKAGKIDLISVLDNELNLIELKCGNNKDTLLHAALEIYTYYKTVDHYKLKMNYGKDNYKIKLVILLVEEANSQKTQAQKEYDEIKERPYLKKLLELINVKVVIIKEEDCK